MITQTEGARGSTPESAADVLLRDEPLQIEYVWRTRESQHTDVWPTTWKQVFLALMPRIEINSEAFHIEGDFRRAFEELLHERKIYPTWVRVSAATRTAIRRRFLELKLIAVSGELGNDDSPPVFRQIEAQPLRTERWTLTDEGRATFEILDARTRRLDFSMLFMKTLRPRLSSWLTPCRRCGFAIHDGIRAHLFRCGTCGRWYCSRCEPYEYKRSYYPRGRSWFRRKARQRAHCEVCWLADVRATRAREAVERERMEARVRREAACRAHDWQRDPKLDERGFTVNWDQYTASEAVSKELSGLGRAKQGWRCSRCGAEKQTW